MDSIPQREDLLNLPTWLLVIVLIAAICGLIALMILPERLRKSRALYLLGLGGVTTVALLLAFNLAARFLTLATSWPVSSIALLGGVSVAILFGLYGLERGIVTPARGRLLLGLRLGALAVLLAILIQPVRSFLLEREISREVSILIDDSASMQLSDQRLTTQEMLDRASLLNVSASANRPAFEQIQETLQIYRTELGNEISALEDAPDAALALESRSELLAAFLDSSDFKPTSERLRTILESLPKLQGDKQNQLREFRTALSERIPKLLNEAREQLDTGAVDPIRSRLKASAEALDQVIAALPAASENADTVFFQSLGEQERQSIEEAAQTSRIDLATAFLNEQRTISEDEKLSFLDQLGERYNLRYYRFGDEISELTRANDGTFALKDLETSAAITDLTGAFDHVLENTSPDSLAGVLLLSDGRHNGAIPTEDALRQLAGQGSRLNAVAIGGQLGPVDSSLLSLEAPESIFLGDRVLVKSEVKLDGLRGKKVKALLKSNGETIEEQIIEVADINYRTELRFIHQPEEKGIFNYRLEIEPIEGELFDNNNAWDFKVAVTDDRTNVLLVDSLPRWEFRYLRNLFYGRDKSVHLQYVLLNPDHISGLPDPPTVHASASRKFGEAEATALPENEDEWRQFDVIILGDLAPNALTREQWEIIEKSVAERGAELITIAGPRHMPHQYENEVVERLLPVTWEVGAKSPDEISRGPEDGYQIELTSAGRAHSVMTQSNSRTINQQIWGQQPTLRWRFAPASVKENAEVLAYASAGGATSGQNTGNPANAEAVEAAIERLANQKQFEAEHSLVTVQRVGLGKVAMLNFDRTWRFRYGVGDTYHHRFWGQLVRWGAGANLRSGNETVRLGTDRLSYTPEDPVAVVAKVLTKDRRPVTDADVYAKIIDPGGKEISRQKLSYLTESSGLYQTSVTGLTEPGEYQIRLDGDGIDKENPVETELLVVTTRNPIELAELTADREFLNRATGLTGGSVVQLNQGDQLIEAFGPPKETLTERKNVTLWDKWPLLVAFLGCVTTEWVLRRRSGLA